MAFAESAAASCCCRSTSWSPSGRSPGAAARVRGLGEVDEHERILDAGPRTVERLNGAMDAAAKTLVWNGPLGVFETPPFDKGTVAAARHAAALAKAGKLVAVAGGGDTVAALNAAGVAGRLHLRLHGRRRVPGMDGGQDPARRGGFARLGRRG